MSLPSVKIQELEGGLGRVVAGDDSVSGLIATGVAVVDGIQLNTPVVITGLADALALGIKPDYDTTNSVKLYKNVREFYTFNEIGTKLYLLVLANTVTLTQMADEANDYVAKLVALSGGTIRQIGITRVPPAGYAPVITQGIDPDVVTALGKAQQQAETLATAGTPALFVVEGRAMSSTFGSVLDLHTLDFDRVAVMAGNTEAGLGTAVGFMLGRIASVAVNRNIGYAGNASTGVVIAYLAGNNVTSFTRGQLTAIHDKGFNFLILKSGQAVYNFNDGQMACSLNSDFAYLAERRVIDKAHRICNIVYAQRLLKEVSVDENGSLLSVEAKALESALEKGIEDNMAGEYSQFDAFIDANQDVITASTLQVAARLIPTGTLRTIEVSLGLSKSL